MKSNFIYRYVSILMILAFTAVGMLQYHHHHSNGDTHIALIGMDFNITKNATPPTIAHDHNCDCDHSDHSSPLPGGPTHDCDHSTCALNMQLTILEKQQRTPIHESHLHCNASHCRVSIVALLDCLLYSPALESESSLIYYTELVPSVIGRDKVIDPLRGPPIC